MEERAWIWLVATIKRETLAKFGCLPVVVYQGGPVRM